MTGIHVDGDEIGQISVAPLGVLSKSLFHPSRFDSPFSMHPSKSFSIYYYLTRVDGAPWRQDPRDPFWPATWMAHHEAEAFIPLTNNLLL